MEQQVRTKFSVYGLLCDIVIWHLRLLSVPIEMITHFGVGERYFGFTGLLAVLLMWADAWWEGSSALYMLMTVVVLRVVAHRIWCVRCRMVGYPLVNSRVPGDPILGIVLPRIPAAAMRWIEPVLVMVVALVLGLISSPLGGYLMWSGFGLLCITIVRASISYNQMLDQLDAQVEPKLPLPNTSDRMLFDQVPSGQLLEA